jgi:eukaryotic-like serine/threonine-protein kinase
MVGQTISHYRTLSALGSGGMGVVYEAEDLRLGRHVALKLLSPDAGGDAAALDRFMREARIVSTLSHPHICTLHDIGEHNGQPFMVMELLEGESLKQRIGRGPLPIDEVLELGVQIGDALDAAHAAGVIHRDIKPANLFITRRGQAKVLDFGVAKLAASDGEDRPELAHTQSVGERTTAGAAIGTVAYMSPEQARGQEIDARSDLFSFGEVLYEMATGAPAFAGSTPAVIFEGILTKQPIPASHVNANVPAELDRIISKALEKDRETRYQSAAELRADLKRLKRETDTGYTLAGATGAAGATNATNRRSRKRMLLVGAPVVTLAVIGGAIMWQSQQTPALAMRDTVVLADFRNRTGDTMFDDTLSEALAVQLRQSPYLNLLPEPQVQMTLQQMGRPAMEPLTPEVAREVCVRSSAKAMLGGTIAAVGNTYLLTLGAQDCVSGNILAEEQASATGKDNVVAALGQAASTFRSKLGESLASVRQYDKHIEQATTRSLEALKAYSQGMTARRTHGDYDSVAFFRRAVELDPEFALALARLGTVLGNLGQNDEAVKVARRAYDLREKVSERERLYIEARFYTTVDRNPEKAIEAYRLLLATYPDDYAANTNIGSLYRNSGRLREALQHLEEGVRLGPTQPLAHLNLGGAYMDDGRFDDARREYEAVLGIQESLNARLRLATLATWTGDRALAEKHLAEAKTPRGEPDLLAVRAQAAAHNGQLEESSRWTNELLRALVTAKRLKDLSGLMFGLTINQAMTGRLDDARALRDQLLKAGAGDADSDGIVALAAIMGEKDVVRTHVDRVLKQLGANAKTEESQKAERAVRALDAFANQRYEQAYDLAAANGTDFAQRNGVFLAGLAALRLQRWNDAVTMFEAWLAFGLKNGLSPMHAVGKIMLARALAGSGRASDARKAYEEAFRIWKDADPDLPLLLEARREYQQLSS